MKYTTLLDKKILKKFIKIAGNTLNGNWVLIGGTVLPLLEVDYRATVDIDLISTIPTQQNQTLKLMEIAENLGLPIESVNQAAAFFLYRIKDFNHHLLLLHQGKTCKIFRPNLYLYVLLKLKRFSESDCSDCLHYLQFTQKNKEQYNKQKLVSEILKELENTNTQEKKVRLKALLNALG